VSLDNDINESTKLKCGKVTSYQNPEIPMPSYQDAIYKSVYATNDPFGQITQTISSYFRSISCNYTMNELFLSKDKFSNDLTDILNKEMIKYGYVVIKTLIMDIDPPEKVKATMNLVLESKNKREAMINQAEAEMETAILKAKGLAETRRLEGVGLAAQRKAVNDGLKDCIHNMCGKDAKIDQTELTNTIVKMQYIDMLNVAAQSGKNTFIMQCNPNAVNNFEQQMQNAILSTKDNITTDS
jgi:regulator of protease activity HflC (stomatin/prohibitin superfamily)